MNTLLRLSIVGLSLFALGCSSEDSGLRGSLQDFYNTNYSDVRARLYESELSIEYVRENGQVPVRVTLRRVEGDPIQTGKYDLSKNGTITGRSSDNDIPPLVSGSLILEEFSAVNGSTLIGNFNARFRTGDDEASLSGDFDTELEVVDQIIGFDVDLSYLRDADM